MSGRELRLTAEELSPLVRECLDSGQEVRLTVTGNSMAPFLRHERDVAVLIKPQDTMALRVGDVLLYQRKNGRLVLHRLVARQEKPVVYTMCGDAQVQPERGIMPEQVIAVVRAFERKGKRYECAGAAYRCYVRHWSFWGFLRRPLMWLYYFPERCGHLLHKTRSVYEKNNRE